MLLTTGRVGQELNVLDTLPQLIEHRPRARQQRVAVHIIVGTTPRGRRSNTRSFPVGLSASSTNVIEFAVNSVSGSNFFAAALMILGAVLFVAVDSRSGVKPTRLAHHQSASPDPSLPCAAQGFCRATCLQTPFRLA
jgi:hypothetical protein